ncbi:helix-turn-helix transcriptional regulator [Chromobacterium phragmitis]|nr:helix-turn-helix transcriptional regulator [Chromobacterium amazonense]MBM2884883.1 helix-turn-helix transcriptional regulator [Chromobacterium amazonense]
MVEDENTPQTLLGQNICSAMQQQSISIKDISGALGVSFEMARRYTLGLARPRSAKLEKLATLLKTTPAALEYGQPPAVTFVTRSAPITSTQGHETGEPEYSPEAIAKWLAQQDRSAMAEFLVSLASELKKETH